MESGIPLGIKDGGEASAENREHHQVSPGKVQLKHGQGTQKISFQNSDIPLVRVLEEDFSKDSYLEKLMGLCVCFYRMGTAKGTSVTITNSNSKARDAGVSKSSYKMMMIIFCMAKQHIFP